MPSSRATRAAEDTGLRPPSPAPTSPRLLCYPSTFKTAGGWLPAPDEQEHPARFTGSGERWLRTAAGWPARFPAASEHRKRQEELRFPQRSRAGCLPTDPPAEAGRTGCGGSPARGESWETLILQPVRDMTGRGSTTLRDFSTVCYKY